MAIRALFVDIGGVLEVSADGREPTFAFEAIIAAWERRLSLDEGKLLAWLESKSEAGLVGAITYEDWRAGLCALMPSVDLESFLADFWRVYLGSLNGELAMWLRAQRPRFKTALLSNSFVGAREAEEARYGFSDLTDDIVYSHEVGVAKPDRRIYEIACERLGVAPAEAVLLDDVPSYLEGATAAGMKTVRFRDNESAIAALESICR
jgi:putative hydrolase of the HAD superfamily